MRFTFLFSALIVLLIAQQQQLVQTPGSGRVATAVADALHGSWFACVTWLMLILVGRWTRPGAAIALMALVGVVIAVGTELLQKLFGGDAEAGDYSSTWSAWAPRCVCGACTGDCLPHASAFRWLCCSSSDRCGRWFRRF